MINKDIREFKADLDKYNASLNNALNKEECEKSWKQFFGYSNKTLCLKMTNRVLSLKTGNETQE